MEYEETKQESSALGVVFAGAFFLLVAAPILAVGLGLLLSHIIPGCNVGEDGASHCLVFGVSLNWPVFWLTIGGTWATIFGIPTFVVIAILLGIVGAILEKAHHRREV